MDPIQNWIARLYLTEERDLTQVMLHASWEIYGKPVFFLHFRMLIASLHCWLSLYDLHFTSFHPILAIDAYCFHPPIDLERSFLSVDNHSPITTHT